MEETNRTVKKYYDPFVKKWRKSMEKPDLFVSDEVKKEETRIASVINIDDYRRKHK